MKIIRMCLLGYGVCKFMDLEKASQNQTSGVKVFALMAMDYERVMDFVMREVASNLIPVFLATKKAVLLLC